jgi:hypothetical protein
MSPREIQGLKPIARLYRPVTVRREEIVEELHVELIILNDQDGLTHQTRIGTPPLDVRPRLLIGHAHPPMLQTVFVHRFSAKPLTYFAAKAVTNS